MGLLKHFQRNRGAGILFVRHRDSGDASVWEVLLCRRRKSGQWSIPGGLKNKEDHRTCALREASEEVRSPDGPTPDQKLPCVFSLRRPPLYSWDTYLWVIDHDSRFASDWPNWHCPEFTEARWFTFETLPEPLYFLMRPALANARRALHHGT